MPLESERKKEKKQKLYEMLTVSVLIDIKFIQIIISIHYVSTAACFHLQY